MVAVGVVRTPSDADPGQRLLFLERELDAWLDRFAPDVMAVERVFAEVNVATVMGTAHATAVALLTATKRGIPVVFHTPTEVKAAVTGYGRADKAQVTAMVTRILGLEVAPRPADAADALAWPSATPGAAAQARLDAAGRPRRCRAGPPVIASVRGPVTHVGLDHVVVEVGGVGMLVHATPATASALPPRRRGVAGHHPRRPRGLPDALRLRHPAERDMFETVQTVSGRRPPAGAGDALGHGPEQLAVALATGRHQGAHQGPGHRREVGRAHRARAARQGRAVRGSGAAAGPARPPAPGGREPWRDQVTEALVGLGWSAKQAGDAVERVAASAPADADIAAYLRWPCASCGRERRRAQPDAARQRMPEAQVRRRRAPTAPTRPPPGSSTPPAPTTTGSSRRPCAPSGSSEFPGQPRVRDQLGLVLEAARRRGSAPTTCCSRARPGSARRPWR